MEKNHFFIYYFAYDIKRIFIVVFEVYLSQVDFLIRLDNHVIDLKTIVQIFPLLGLFKFKMNVIKLAES